MFTKINLINELRNTAAQNRLQAIKEADEALRSVSEFLKQEDKETSSMLEHFGYSRVVEKAKRSKKEIDERVQKAKKFQNMEYLTQEDIKTVCEKYYLKFLPANQYNMPVPMHALEALKEFAKNSDICASWTGRRSIDRDRLFMIAPPSHFKLFERPEPEDPVMLYKIEDGTYVIITQWGNDFTFVRKIYGTLNKFLKTFYMVVLSLSLIVFTIVNFWNVLGNGDSGIVFRTFSVMAGFIIFIVSMVYANKLYMKYDSPYKK